MKKEEFKKEAKTTIDDIFARMDELEAKKDQAQGTVKAEYEETLYAMKGKKKEIQAKYDELVNASDEKWEEVKSAFSSANDSFKEGFSKIASLI